MVIYTAHISIKQVKTNQGLGVKKGLKDMFNPVADES